MGYLFLLFGGAVLVIAVIVAVFSSRSSAPPGRGTLGSSVGPAKPASEEPTPDRSDTHPPERVEKARERTPPA